METLSGKSAIVTGGTRGIGRAIAARLLREGAAVAVCSRSPESVTRAMAEMQPLGRITGYPADVTKFNEVRNFFHTVEAEFGGVDILINNAGSGVFQKVAEMSPEEWLRNIEVNLNGAFYCSHEALAAFSCRGGGSIVNISSLAGKNAFSGGAGYNAAKSGLNAFSEAMMLDHRYDNVRVTYIMPGSVATEFAGGPSDRSGDTGWMIAPEDVAETVALVLRMPLRTMISRIEMRPSRPQK